MKHFYTTLALLITTICFGQIPAGYYNTATGTGYNLKTQLYNIINGHNDQGYNALDNLYGISDLDIYYESDNTILDMYSENPTGTDPYNYIFGADECGNYNSEGDCYNKEHLIPQSVFNENLPMRSDAHHIVPTDGRVNGLRSNYPMGVVGTTVPQSGISNPTLNGSKMGNNLNSGYSAGYTGLVFEPIDEFKGDIARIYFYFVTRYQNLVGNWSSYAMFDGSTDKVFTDTFLNILLTWHQNDPVSQKEIDRNNAIYNYQGNRNPFVDHPEWAALIWNPTPDTEAPTTPGNLIVTNETAYSISLSWTASTDNVAVTSYDVYVDGIFNTNVTANLATITQLTPETTYEFYVIAKDAANNTSAQSNTVEGTTLEEGASGSECIDETFENIPGSASNYATRTWTGNDGGTWTATRARTDETIDGRAITIDYRSSSQEESLTSPAIANGIGNLTVTTQRKYGSGSGTLDLYVNNVFVNTIPYSGSVQTSTINNINITGNVTIAIKGSGAERIAIDNLSWTCHTGLSIDKPSIEQVRVYPNPVKNQLYIILNNSVTTTIEIYDVLGKKVLTQTIQQSESITTDSLKTGIYILKITQADKSVTKKLIKH